MTDARKGESGGGDVPEAEGQSAAQAGDMPNGDGAAAILAAGAGSLSLGLFALAGDALQPLARSFTIWPPSGPLSGVTACAVAVWLLLWLGLARRWAGRSVDLAPIAAAAFAMLAGALLLTFPPFMDLLQGK